MNRRHFLRTSLATTTLAMSPYGVKAADAATEETGRDYYELRRYRLKDALHRQRLDAYLEGAAIPALNRLGVKAVGAFVASDTAEPTDVHLLIPYPSIELVTAAAELPRADAELQRLGGEYLSAPQSDPVFERIDVWLFRAFAGIPRTELPDYCRDRKSRVFELRIYESHSEERALKKMEMFDVGEIQVMRDVGLAPIFFGQALAGSDLPHLAYLLSAETTEAHKEHWKAFGEHPVWKRLRDDPEYADTVSKITNHFLVPTAYSQI